MDPSHHGDRARGPAQSPRMLRRAAAMASSPRSIRPPGKLTSPRCVRIDVERLVRIRRASPASSKSTTSFAVDASTWDLVTPNAAPSGAFTTRLLLLGFETLAGQPHRGGLELSVDLPVELGPRLLDRPIRCDAQHAFPRCHHRDRRVRRLVGLLPGQGDVPLFVFDAGYDPIAIGHELVDVRRETLTRIRDDRVFY